MALWRASHCSMSVIWRIREGWRRTASQGPGVVLGFCYSHGTDAQHEAHLHLLPTRQMHG